MFCIGNLSQLWKECLDEIYQFVSSESYPVEEQNEIRENKICSTSTSTTAGPPSKEAGGGGGGRLVVDTAGEGRGSPTTTTTSTNYTSRSKTSFCSSLSPSSCFSSASRIATSSVPAAQESAAAPPTIVNDEEKKPSPPKVLPNLPERIFKLYLKGCSKVAKAKQRHQTFQENQREHHILRAAPAGTKAGFGFANNAHQLALYKQGVERIRQQQQQQKTGLLSPKSAKQEYRRDRNEHELTGIRTRTGRDLYRVSTLKDASNRLLALYKQGTEKLLQLRMSSCSYNSQHENEPMGLVLSSSGNIVLSSSTRINRRQRSLYIFGVKTLREKNRQHIILNEAVSAATSASDYYYKRLYQLLQNYVLAKNNVMIRKKNRSSETPLVSSSRLTGEEQSSLPSRHQTAFDIAAKTMSGIFSKLSVDFPEIHDFHESTTRSQSMFLAKENKATTNLYKLHIKSKRDLLLALSSRKCSSTRSRRTKASTNREEITESITNTSTFQAGTTSSTKNQEHHHHEQQEEEEDADIDVHALTLGLRGIVMQYLLDVVKEIQRIG